MEDCYKQSAAAEQLVFTTVLPCSLTTIKCFLNKTAHYLSIALQSSGKTRTTEHAGCQVWAAHLSHCQTAFSSFKMKHTRDTENAVFYF